MNTDRTLLDSRSCKTCMFYVTPCYVGRSDQNKFTVIRVDDDESETEICNYPTLRMARLYMRWVCKFRDGQTKLTFSNWMVQRLKYDLP